VCVFPSDVSRAVLLRLPGEPKPSRLTDYVGTKYSFQQHPNDGHRCWRLRSLGEGRSDVSLAPAEVRPIFLRVVLDCLAPAVC
jgi:hypothetical protein